jgi:hypothetical protein
MTTPNNFNLSDLNSIGTSSDWTYQSTSPTPLSSTSFPLTETSSDGDPFCTEEFCDYEDIYRSRFFQVRTLGGGGSVSPDANFDGTESIRDIDGTIYATHRWIATEVYGDPPYCEGPVVTRVSPPNPDVTIEWTKQYKCIDGLLFRRDFAHIKFDNYGNLWLVYRTCSANGTSTVPGVTDLGTYQVNIHFLRISKSTGNILFHKSFALQILSSGYITPVLIQVIIDKQGNWYIASEREYPDSWIPNTVSQTGPYIIKFNANLEVLWGARWVGGRYLSGSYYAAYQQFHNMTISEDAIYVSSFSQSYRDSVSFIKINKHTGAFLSWLPRREYSFQVGREVTANLAIDSAKNVYAVLGTRIRSPEIDVMKITPSGQTLWHKAFSVTGNAPVYESEYSISRFSISITAGDRIFLGANLYRPSNPIAYVLEITTDGALVSVRKYTNSVDSSYQRMLQVSTFDYSPNTLLIRRNGGDHVDTTQDVEVFNVPGRLMESIPLRTPTVPEPLLIDSVTVAIVDTWGSVRSDFVPYSTSFTATAPDLTTRLWDIAQIRD